MVDLSGQVALVTGAGRGIGRGIAIALARAGATVVVAARSAGQVEAVADEIARAGGQALAATCDVAEEDQVAALFARLDDEFGRLDVLINNAGIGRFSPVADLDAADVKRMLAVNVTGTLLCCREAMRRMIPVGRGTIINISSVVGFKGYPRQAGYTASKHAVMGLTKSLAVEGQEHGIRVSAILPGGVDTDMVRQARPDLDPAILMQPEDIAGAVLFLLGLSDRCAIDEIYIRRRGSTPF